MKRYLSLLFVVVLFSWVECPLNAQAVSDDFGMGPLRTASFTETVDISGFTTQLGEPDHNTFSPGTGPNRSAWWRFMPVRSGYLFITTRGSEISNALSVYRGSAVGSLTRVRGLVAAPSSFTQVDWTFAVGVNGGEMLHVAVDGFGAGDSGNVQIEFRTVVFERSTYVGGIYTSNDPQDNGLLELNTTTTGAWSAKLRVGALTLSARGVIGRDGSYSAMVPVPRKKNEPPTLPLEFRLDPTSSPNELAGSFTNPSGSFLIVPRKVPVYSNSSPCPVVGQHALVAQTPSGAFGYWPITVKVSKLGQFVAQMFPVDGTTVTFSGRVSASSSNTVFHVNGYRPTFGGTGHYNLFLDMDTSSSVVGGSVSASRPLLPTSGITYRFIDQVGGNFYFPTVPNTRFVSLFDAHGGRTEFVTADHPGGELSQIATLSTSNVFAYQAPNAINLKLKVDRLSGLVTSEFTSNGVRSRGRMIFVDLPTSGLPGGCYGFFSGNGFGSSTLLSSPPPP
jgi:hypothetical protein